MSELSTSFSSNKKIVTVNFSDKINPLIDQLFSKVNESLYKNKFFEAQQYINLISLYNPLSTIEHLKLYFFSFEICKNFYSLHRQKFAKKEKNESKDNNTSSISCNLLQKDIYLMKLFFCVKKMIKYFLKYKDNLNIKYKHIILTKIYQFCTILHKEKEFLLEFYFISKLCENEEFNKIMDSNIRSEILCRKKCLYNILNDEINKRRKQYRNNIYSNEYDILRNNFLNKYDLDEGKLKEGDLCYIISTHWIKTFIYYIDIISKESNNEENDIELGHLLFQFSKTYFLYYNRNLSKDQFYKYAPCFPGPINNTFIVGNFNFWYDPKKGEEYTNQFLSKRIENDDYQIVREDIYNILTKVFGHPLNEISRKIHINETENIPELEIHLLKFKIILLCKTLLNNEKLAHLNQMKEIQISRKKTFNNLVTKLIRSLNHEVALINGEELINFNMQKNMKYHIIIPDII